MTSYLVDGVLLLALVLTSIRVGTMHRELKRLRRYHGEYRQVFSETSQALGSVEGAIRTLNGEGRVVLEALGARIDEARSLAARLEAISRAAAQPTASAAEPDDVDTYSPALLSRKAAAEPADRKAVGFLKELQAVGRDAAIERALEAAGERTGWRAAERLAAARTR
jgi:hypothetical protein